MNHKLIPALVAIVLVAGACSSSNRPAPSETTQAAAAGTTAPAPTTSPVVDVPDSKEATGASVAKVGRVEIAVASSLPEDRRARFDKAGGPGSLKVQVENSLSRVGRLDPSSPNVLQVTVTGYRMRSGASVYFLGAMGGADSMAVSCAVTSGGQTIRTYSTGSGSIGWGAGLSQESRLDNLTDATAKRVVADL
jgi:hypothetical protein